MANTVIFDIDGTLADCEHRRVHADRVKCVLCLVYNPDLSTRCPKDDYGTHVTNKAPDWEAFHRDLHLDGPIGPVIALNTMVAANGARIVLCTGRWERDRARTVEWLRNHGVIYQALYMRQDDDYRQDTEVKREMLEAIGKENVLFVVDDRQSVVDMWRAEGLVCLQCAPGDF